MIMNLFIGITLIAPSYPSKHNNKIYSLGLWNLHILCVNFGLNNTTHKHMRCRSHVPTIKMCLCLVCRVCVNFLAQNFKMSLHNGLLIVLFCYVMLIFNIIAWMLPASMCSALSVRLSLVLAWAFLFTQFRINMTVYCICIDGISEAAVFSIRHLLSVSERIFDAFDS